MSHVPSMKGLDLCVERALALTMITTALVLKPVMSAGWALPMNGGRR
jgi:hypothetical protein